MVERFYPTEANLGKNCRFWDLSGRFAGCNFPKVDMEGRTSCEGAIDEVCLYLKDGRLPKDHKIKVEDLKSLKLQPPNLGQKPHIPPDSAP